VWRCLSGLALLSPLRALRRLHSVGGGGGAWSAQFTNVAYFFKSFSAKNLRYKDMRVQQLFFAVV